MTWPRLRFLRSGFGVFVASGLARAQEATGELAAPESVTSFHFSSAPPGWLFFLILLPLLGAFVWATYRFTEVASPRGRGPGDRAGGGALGQGEVDGRRRASIPGIRRWPEAYLPGFFDKNRVDSIIDIAQDDALTAMRKLAREEGIFCGVSSGGAVAGALKLAQGLENATIVAIICDRGDRYLSTGLYKR